MGKQTGDSDDAATRDTHDDSNQLQTHLKKNEDEQDLLLNHLNDFERNIRDMTQFKEEMYKQVD